MPFVPKPPGSGPRATEVGVTVDLARATAFDPGLASPPSPLPPAPSSAISPVPALKSHAYVGQTIDGRYLVERVLGEGGMGVVYAGRHKVIEKRVAIKVLRGEMAADQDLNDRFLQEARAASAIGNPHIIDISDFGQLPDGLTYFVMELLDGKSLSAALAECQGPMPVRRIYAIAKQIAEGLAAAHAANIIHRDLKPDNVMLIDRSHEKDFVKVLDFGIAKVGSGSKKVTRAGSVFGTPHYMSPEQAAGAVVDHRTDIYALGVILYELASGKVPFDADNFMGILTQHMYKAPVPIRALLPEIDVPPGLDAVVLKCLTKKPEGRYATMGDLLADLEKLERGLLPDAVAEMMARSGGFNVPADYFRSAMPAPVPASPADRSTRGPLYAAVAAIAVLGCAGIAAVVFRGTAHSPEEAPSVGSTAALIAPAPVVPRAKESAGGLVASPSAPQAAELHEVLVSVAPADATIRRGDLDLGQSPLALHLASGETAVLQLERNGYKTATVTVDATQPKQTFTLEPIPSAPKPAAAPPKRPSPAPGAAPSPALGGIDDVGDPFAAKK